jgi:cysteine desulfurase
VVGRLSLAFSHLPVDLLSCAAHKLQGPRGIGALLVRPGIDLAPLIGGGGQEGGRRGGTEAVVLTAGFAAALDLAQERLITHGGSDPIRGLRDELLERLLACEGIRLSGPAADDPLGRLPHHISLLVSGDDGMPLSGRALVRALWQQGYAVSSGSACSSSAAAGAGAASPILRAMGYGEAEAESGVRLSLGPWLQSHHLAAVPQALAQARRTLGGGLRSSREG